MAKVLKDFDFDKKPIPKPESFLDGRIWELKQGEDFDATIENFKHSLYKRARARELKVKTWFNGEVLVVQAYKEERSDDGEQVGNGQGVDESSQ